MPLAVDDNSASGAHTHAGADITSGTVVDARLSSKVALDDQKEYKQEENSIYLYFLKVYFFFSYQ